MRLLAKALPVIALVLGGCSVLETGRQLDHLTLSGDMALVTGAEQSCAPSRRRSVTPGDYKLSHVARRQIRGIKANPNLTKLISSQFAAALKAEITSEWIVVDLETKSSKKEPSIYSSLESWERLNEHDEIIL